MKPWTGKGMLGALCLAMAALLAGCGGEGSPRADLVVLSRDISQIDPAELPDTEAVTTIVGGKVVYERK
ncbi:MAG: amidohydrolase family protein [Balneolaceae bacterium]|nr:amidohydrolase family protein [Balneolaceae bacterium]